MTENPSTESMVAASSDKEEEQSNFDFDQFITDAENKIEELRTRRDSIETRKKNYRNLKVDSATLKDIELSSEIEEKIGQAEYGLFNELVELVGEEHLGWKKTGEEFWAGFRYGGIGFVLGILLHHLLN